MEEVEVFAENAGSVRYIRLGDVDGDGTVSALVEFGRQEDIPIALQLHGHTLNDNVIKWVYYKAVDFANFGDIFGGNFS